MYRSSFHSTISLPTKTQWSTNIKKPGRNSSFKMVRNWNSSQIVPMSITPPSRTNWRYFSSKMSRLAALVVLNLGSSLKHSFHGMTSSESGSMLVIVNRYQMDTTSSKRLSSQAHSSFVSTLGLRMTKSDAPTHKTLSLIKRTGELSDWRSLCKPWGLKATQQMV